MKVCHQEKDQIDGVTSNIQKKEESIEPRSNKDKGDISKRTINTSSHVQRKTVFDSSLTGETDYVTTFSNQGITTTQLGKEMPDQKTILGEDIYNSEYHSTA